MKDPIVEELHKIRERLACDCGNDFRRMLERGRVVFQQWKGKRVTREDLVGVADHDNVASIKVAEGKATYGRD